MNNEQKSYDVFISYRRKGGSERAELIKAKLEQFGYKADKIFMDTHSLRAGDYRKELKEAIAKSANVIVVVTKESFENIKDEDYFVFELTEAMNLQKNMVFCYFDDITSIDSSKLPDALKSMSYHNSVRYNHDYSDAFYSKLCSFLVKKRSFVPIGIVAFIGLVLVFAGIFLYHRYNSDVISPVEETDCDSSYVDLGLPSGTLWATCNLGATNPSDFGCYYMWGSVEPVDKNGHQDLRYFISSPDIIGTSYDAASISLGKHWRMPSEKQIAELMEKCDWQWTNLDGNNGYEIKGPNERTLFLPVAGCVKLQGYDNGNQFGYYWIGERNPSNAKSAKELIIGLNQINIDFGRQYLGRSIRPVYEE